MSLWDAMFCGGIVGRSLQWAERSLTGHAALHLPLHFLRRALLQRISAASNRKACDHQQDRHAFHLLILRTKSGIAIPLKRSTRESFRSLTAEALHCFIALIFQRFASHDF